MERLLNMEESKFENTDSSRTIGLPPPTSSFSSSNPQELYWLDPLSSSMKQRIGTTGCNNPIETTSSHYLSCPADSALEQTTQSILFPALPISPLVTDTREDTLSYTGESIALEVEIVLAQHLAQQRSCGTQRRNSAQSQRSLLLDEDPYAYLDIPLDNGPDKRSSRRPEQEQQGSSNGTPRDILQSLVSSLVSSSRIVADKLESGPETWIRDVNGSTSLEFLPDSISTLQILSNSLSTLHLPLMSPENVNLKSYNTNSPTAHSAPIISSSWAVKTNCRQTLCPYIPNTNSEVENMPNGSLVTNELLSDLAAIKVSQATAALKSETMLCPDKRRTESSDITSSDRCPLLQPTNSSKLGLMMTANHEKNNHAPCCNAYSTTRLLPTFANESTGNGCRPPGIGGACARLSPVLNSMNAPADIGDQQPALPKESDCVQHQQARAQIDLFTAHLSEKKGFENPTTREGAGKLNTSTVTAQKKGGETKKIGRPKLDRSNLKCPACGAGNTSQWRYLPIPLMLEFMFMFSGSGGNFPSSLDQQEVCQRRGKVCICNACWLRVKKKLHKNDVARSILTSSHKESTSPST